MTSWPCGAELRRVASAVLLLATALAPAAFSDETGEPAAEAPRRNGLEGVDWRLVRLGDRAVEVAKPEQAPTLRLDAAEHRAGGSGGCNRFGGGYELDGAKLRFGEMASTQMACEHGMETEAAYYAALGQVRGWRLVAGRLELLDEGGQVLAAFEPAPAP